MFQIQLTISLCNGSQISSFLADGTGGGKIETPNDYGKPNYGIQDTRSGKLILDYQLTCYNSGIDHENIKAQNILPITHFKRIDVIDKCSIQEILVMMSNVMHS